MRFESHRTSRLHRAIWATKPPNQLLLGHTPNTAGTSRNSIKKIRKNSGKTLDLLSEGFLEFPSRAWLDPPNPTIQGIWGFQSISRILSPSERLGTPLFFRSGSGEGLPGLVMEFPAVLRAFLTYESFGHPTKNHAKPTKTAKFLKFWSLNLLVFSPDLRCPNLRSPWDARIQKLLITGDMKNVIF